VTTVEGIGTQAAPHPVQARISACHGSQCGFCTPGIVMALFSKLQSNPHPSLEDIEETFDGNLCRCTGYRPIIDAAKTFARDAVACPAAPSGAEVAAANSNAGGSRKRPVVSTSLSKLTHEKQQRHTSAAPLPPPPVVPNECLALARQPLRISRGGVTWHRPSTLAQLLALKQTFPKAKLITGNTEVGIETRFKHFEYPNLIHTAAVPELGALETLADGSVHVGGGVTLTRLEHHLEHMLADASVAAFATRGFRAIVEMLKWFASGQIRNVASLAGNLCTASPISDLNPVLMSLGAVLTLASEGQATRDVAVRDFFVGYRRTAMAPHEILLSVRIPATSEREFVRCYKQARRRDDDISIANACFRVVVDGASGTISECTTGFGGMAAMTKPSLALEVALQGKSVAAAVDEAVDTDLLSAALAEDFKMRPGAPGGMGAYRETLAVSFGVKFLAYLRSELADQDDAQARDMARTFLRDKRPVTFGVQEYLYDPMGGGLQHAAGKRRDDPDGPTLHTDVTAASSGAVNGDPKKRGPVGQSVMHRSALAQCTGEAKYVDDMPSPPQTLHARFVLSQRPSGRIAGVDLKAAEAAYGECTPHGQRLAGVGSGGQQPGFYYFSANDISYKQNKMGPVRKDEQLFRSATVTAAGQPVGLIVAETAEIARKAAALCKILYDAEASESPTSRAGGDGAESKKDGGPGAGSSKELEALPPVAISIDDAVSCGRLHETRHCIVDGDPDAALARDDLVKVSGTVRIGGQEHFYLECNAALAIPGEGGREMEVFASTQTTTKTHKFAAQVCGLAESRVVVRMKRMGGAFGGKETRSVFASTAVALAAHRLNVPVRINLDRDVDMLATGTRHPFQGKYRCAADRETGKIVAVDIELYSNAGFSTDLSESVMDRALFHCVNAYKVPNVRVQGNLAMTNTVTNTAFRGFGGPQGMLVCETFVEHIAKEIGMDVSEVRRRNMYKEGDLTHYGQVSLSFSSCVVFGGAGEGSLFFVCSCC
jgi:xanthine dehydrogenase/oxidase